MNENEFLVLFNKVDDLHSSNMISDIECKRIKGVLAVNIALCRVLTGLFENIVDIIEEGSE